MDSLIIFFDAFLNIEAKIGEEIIAFGLGLDISGAIFLSLSLIDSSVYYASNLFHTPKDVQIHPKTGKTQELISSIPIENISKSTLNARIGLLFLVLGFLLQFIGNLIPSGNSILYPSMLGLLAIFISNFIGKKWIRRNKSKMLNSILTSGRIDKTIDLEEARDLNKSLKKYDESRILKIIRNFYN